MISSSRTRLIKMTITTKLLQILLYTPGAFFGYPWKPFVNALAGSNYVEAYKHFRRDHHTSANLALHIVCLFFQLVGNFCLLTRMETLSALPSSVYLSPASLTALIWSAYLLNAPAPIGVRRTTVTVVLVSLVVARFVVPLWLETGMGIGYVVVLVLMIRRRRALITGAVIMGWVFFWHWMTSESRSAGMFAEFQIQACLTMVVMLMVASAAKNIPEMPAISGCLLLRVGAFLTDSDVLLCWGFAFTAMILQGLAHKVSGEEATLIHLNQEAKRDGTRMSPREKVAYEWAHVTFFPVLAVHSLYQSFAFSAEIEC